MECVGWRGGGRCQAFQSMLLGWAQWRNQPAAAPAHGPTQNGKGGQIIVAPLVGQWVDNAVARAVMFISSPARVA